ncbi:hypothetical protein [Massilia sp. DD77]|uniref:hypothetical protein n=1 Tax=Massilia sp. DD77 TaxID=3109349 RepID=UPI002FFE6B8D
MQAEKIYAEFVGNFEGRKFSAGLLLAMIDFIKTLEVAGAKFKNFSEVLSEFPRQEKTSAGKRANTLIVRLKNGGTLSLRPFYNAAERLFRAEHKRFDYPSCAPHATQAWIDYIGWLDALTQINLEELDLLRVKVVSYVLDALKSQAFDPSTIKVDPPLFRLLLEGFSMRAEKGEPTGAAYQGIVFGFLRADNPHLQIEIEKVRTGSKRLQRVGDIDGWDGQRLAISAEVKQYELTVDALPDLEAFANATGQRGALGLIVALGFKEDCETEARLMGMLTLDIAGMKKIVELWDPLKQRTAISSFIYYANHIEKNSSLSARIQDFLKNEELRWAERWSYSHSIDISNQEDINAHRDLVLFK